MLSLLAPAFLFSLAWTVAALVLAGADFGRWEISIVWGLGVDIAFYVTGGISGAHLPPGPTHQLGTNVPYYFQ